MRRRTFISGLAEAGLINTPSGFAKATANALDGGQALDDGHEGDRRLVVPVWDPIATTGEAATPAQDGRGTNLRPLLVGLGPAAEAMVEQARHHPLLPPDAGLYRSLAVPGAAGLQSARLALCRSALLLIDIRDPQVRADGLAWARQLEQHQVPMHCAWPCCSGSVRATPKRLGLRRCVER